MDTQLEVKGKNDMGRPSFSEQGPHFIFQSSFYTLSYAYDKFTGKKPGLLHDSTPSPIILYAYLKV